jgi:signal transduction histidine kinase/CheY-like chemotaxis protein
MSTPEPTPPKGQPRAAPPRPFSEEPEAARLARYGRCVDAARLVLWEVDRVPPERWPGREERVYVSRPLADALGIPERELPSQGSDLLGRIHPDDRERWLGSLGRALEHAEPLRVEMRLRTAAGDWRWFRVHGRARGAGGEVAGIRGDSGRATISGAMEDVTDERITELQSRHAQKMDALGRLAGGVAHDFNNLLSVITTYGILLTEELPPADHRREYAEQVTRAAERAATVTRQLLTLSRKQVVQPVETDLNATVTSIVPMLRRLASNDLDVEVDPANDLWHVWVDPTQLQQMIVDLALNAKEAMPKGGTLTVSTRNRFIQSTDAVSSPDASPGRYAVLTVADTGRGIPPEVLPHVFDPFFSTKDAAAGSVGLGLSVVYGATRQAGGFVDVVSRPGQGTQISLFFPAIERRASRSSGPPRPSPPPPPREQRPTILVVEDDEQVRRAIVRILKRAGYRVVQADGADPALREVRGEGPIDLLLTDIVLPGPAGTQLAADARRLRPHVPVLYVSGFTGDTGLGAQQLDDQSAFLEKPFSPTELLAVVASLVRGRSSGPPPLPG